LKSTQIETIAAEAVFTVAVSVCPNVRDVVDVPENGIDL
jgi:hypothetical protein